MQLKSQSGIECPTRKDVPVLVKVCDRIYVYFIDDVHLTGHMT